MVALLCITQKSKIIMNNNEHVYDIHSFLKEVLNLDENYVNDICSYYKVSLTSLVLKSDINDNTGYRKNLLRVYTKNIKLNEKGEEIQDKKTHEEFSDDVIGSPFSIFRKGQRQLTNIKKKSSDYELMETIIFSIIQYEEDSRIEKYDELYDFNKFNYREFCKELKNEYNKTDKNVYSIIKDGKIQRNKSKEGYINLNIKELMYDYHHRDRKFYICLSEWNGQYIATKFMISYESPFTEKITEYFKNGNSVKIRDNGKFLRTINESPLLFFSESSWIAI